MRARSIIFIVLSYFFAMFFIIATLFSRVQAEEYMSHDKIMVGFVHAQKSPQMGHPVLYLPAKKVLGKKHKKGNPHGEQKFSFGRKYNPSPSSSPSPVPTSTSSPDENGGSGSSASGDGDVYFDKVDLRGRDAPIKEQIGPICTAYAGNAGVENLLGKGSPDFSEDYTFSLYRTYSVEKYANTVPGKPLALASMWPRGGKKVNPFSTTDHKLVSISYLGDGEVEKAKQALRAKHPVYFGLEVPSDMASCLASIRPTTKVTKGGHAVLIVGFKDDDTNKALGGGYFIVRNSWSEGCGDHGYQYLPYSYCNKSYCYMYEMSEAQ